ncbi:HK97 family phage prohead protease [Neoaquamicrobium sediminum]|uniref:HK97 family phage prohead protease n=1 Tax=Neoaquamicrobium sediminum TaxID=1849104 RepID=UPI00361C3EED
MGGGKTAAPERRALPVEVRARGRRLEGYAATFGAEADIGGLFVETIAQGAFSGSLKRKADILALVDHDPGRVLARTRSGTLRLSEDSRGLQFDLDVPETSYGRDVLALAERGDVGGMSFSFTPIEEHRDGNRRELRSVELHEVSAVLSWPAYDGTTIQARSLIVPAPIRLYAERTLRILELSR